MRQDGNLKNKKTAYHSLLALHYWQEMIKISFWT